MSIPNEKDEAALRKEYIKQLAKEINYWSGCKFNYNLTKKCMDIAAINALEKIYNKRKK